MVRRFWRISKITASNKEGKKLLRTGTFPNGYWGHVGLGVTPSQLRRQRGNIVKASGLGKTWGLQHDGLGN